MRIDTALNRMQLGWLILSAILGLDIGGANLKVAHTSGAARTVAFPLWKHPDRLADELARLCSAMPAYDSVAITMTGELCDCFPSKCEGVRAILQAVRTAVPQLRVLAWTNTGVFWDIDFAKDLEDDPLCVAAANWLALAHHVADRFPNECVLLIDTGSTTTDIVYLRQGKPEPLGLTDPERLATGALVYTGVRRTPLCAVLGMAVAAECFATMQDAYLCAGLVPEDPADRDTADGRPATLAGARARLARMRCADSATFSDQEARELADLALRTQWQAVSRAMERVLDDKPALDRIVLSGSGEILGRSVCARHHAWSTPPITSLSELLGHALSEAACAYAVAMLAVRERRRWLTQIGPS